MTLRGFVIYSFSFLFAGIAVFGSSFFTALNNGLVSALISFLRTLVFQVAAVLIFPLIWEIDGIWISIVAAELMAAVVTFLFYWANGKSITTERRRCREFPALRSYCRRERPVSDDGCRKIEKLSGCLRRFSGGSTLFAYFFAIC